MFGVVALSAVGRELRLVTPPRFELGSILHQKPPVGSLLTRAPRRLNRRSEGVLNLTCGRKPA